MYTRLQPIVQRLNAPRGRRNELGEIALPETWRVADIVRRYSASLATSNRLRLLTVGALGGSFLHPTVKPIYRLTIDSLERETRPTCRLVTGETTSSDGANEAGWHWADTDRTVDRLRQEKNGAHRRWREEEKANLP